MIDCCLYFIIKVSIVDQKENNENGGSDHIGITMDGSMDAAYSAHADCLTLPLALVPGRRVSFKSSVCIAVLQCLGSVSFVFLLTV